MYISDISVTSYRIQTRSRCVQYGITVHGLTPYLHPMCLYDSDSCLSRDVASFTQWKRFSAVVQLHKALKAEITDLKLPALPRHWLPVRSQAGIQARQRKLNVYFSAVLEIDKAKHSLALSSFFQPAIRLTLRVVGLPGIGKMRIVEAFFNIKHQKESDGLPKLQTGQFMESGVYPDRAELPVDLVVDQALVRISLIEVMSLTQDEELADTDGIIFAFSEEVPASLAAVRKKRREIDVDSAVIALDEGPDISQGQFSASSLSDVYTVFEYLVRRHLRRERR